MASTYLSRTPSSTTDTQRKQFTISMWVKRSSLGTGGGHQEVVSAYSTDQFGFRFDGNNKLDIFEYSVSGNTYPLRLTTNRLFRDVNAWYHIVLQVDTPNATSSNRAKLYINGVQETSFETANYPSQDLTLTWNKNGLHQIASKAWGNSGNGSDFFSGYISHLSNVAGSVVAPTVFGETDSTSGIWKFKSPSGVNWGTNGFHLKFENSAALGTDSSGNTNTFTVNGNLTQTVDTPTNNWVTFNPLLNSGSGQVSYSRANTRGGTGGGLTYLTMMPSAGKWFMEFNINVAGAGQDNGIGFWSVDEAQRIAFYASGFKGIVWKYAGNVYVNGTNNVFSSSTFTSGDIISVAMDMDNSTATFYKNGSVATNLNAYSFPFTERQAISVGIMDGATASAEDGIFDFNSGANPTFGGRKTAGGNSDGNSQGNFSMAVPSGYYALNTKNLNTYG